MWKRLRHLLDFYWRAETKYTVHSPFVFELLETVIEDQRQYYDFGPLEHWRYLLERNTNTIQVTDLGAGSHIDKGTERQIANIAKHAVSPTWQCQLLFRLVHQLQCKHRLELGTSLGMSSLYQYLPIRQGSLHTIEGCPNIAAIAKEGFKRFKAKGIQQYIGSFEEQLPKALAQMPSLDYVFIDGNHQLKATLHYFEQCLAHSHPQTVFVFDDIYWSEEMAAAWQVIKAHPSVRLSIDLYYLGLIFIRPAQKEVQHFSLVPTLYKPWKMGFFPPKFQQS